jgi:small subunit ribosomal protein S16
MAVKIRLRRIGKNPKGRPHFRIAVYDERAGRDSKSIEELGFYDPKDGKVKIDKERFEFWKQKGALPSDTVKSLVKKLAKET